MTTGETIPVGVAFGSNEGDRLANLQAARARIRMLPHVINGSGEAGWCAPVFETEPVDCPPGAGPFLNTVVEIPWLPAVSPTTLLTGLRGIENALGRPTRHPRHAPRTVDLDILYFGGLRLDLPELTIPHPRLAQRRFVLAPLAAIRPGLVLPGQTRTVSELLRTLDSEGKVTLYATHW